MHRVNLNTTAPAVKEFLTQLSRAANEVEIELDGKVLFRLVPERTVTGAEKDVLVARGRELVQRARARNKAVAAREIAREVDDAVAKVRSARSA